MQRTAWLLVCSIAFVGCQRGSAPVASKESESASDVAKAVATDADNASAVTKADFRTADSSATQDSPAILVKKFVNALRAGDARTVSNLLTEKARYETRRHGLEVKPSLFPNTSFEVEDTEFASERKDLAYVGCRWIESPTEGKEFKLVWIAKRQEEGWRISGFATPLVEGQKSQLLNFENVQEMLSVMDQASGEEESAKSENASSSGR
jgi:hypothetical protein